MTETPNPNQSKKPAGPDVFDLFGFFPVDPKSKERFQAQADDVITLISGVVDPIVRGARSAARDVHRSAKAAVSDDETLTYTINVAGVASEDIDLELLGEEGYVKVTYPNLDNPEKKQEQILPVHPGSTSVDIDLKYSHGLVTITARKPEKASEKLSFA